MGMRVIEVDCRCGRKLFKYQKVGTGRLLKCYLPRILTDHAGIPASAKTGEEIYCPACGGRVGTLSMIRGVPALKLNQGGIKPFRLG